MSLARLLKVPLKYFQKDVIAFLVIRRHDLGLTEDLLRFIAVKPTASISMLRQKVWHLLDLPDYCEELILLKTSDNVEIPLTELRKGNQPQRPFILEVWLPSKQMQSTASTIHNHMLTMRHEDDATETHSSLYSYQDKANINEKCIVNDSCSSTTEDNIALNKLRLVNEKRKGFGDFIHCEFKKSDLSCRISNSSLFLKMPRKKSKDNFANILLKIQSDLTNLSKKLSSLENRIPS